MKTQLSFICSLGLLVGMSGCSTLDTENSEEMLASAGFEMKLADTPQKEANLKKLPPDQVVPQNGASGELRYLYADPRNNRVFVGDRAAYEHYQQLLTKQDIAMREQLATVNYDDSMFEWDTWGMGW